MDSQLPFNFLLSKQHCMLFWVFPYRKVLGNPKCGAAESKDSLFLEIFVPSYQNFPPGNLQKIFIPTMVYEFWQYSLPFLGGEKLGEV